MKKLALGKPDVQTLGKPDSKDSTPTQPTKRSVLPGVKPELFEVQTASFVITETRIKEERVLGKKFNEEIAQGRKFFGNKIRDS